MVCFNGAAIYDFNDEKLLWASTLDKGALKCVEYMDKMFDFVGIEVCTSDKIYFCKVNQKVREHQVLEDLPDNFLDYHDIKEDWVKVLFMVEENEIRLQIHRLLMIMNLCSPVLGIMNFCLKTQVRVRGLCTLPI